MGDEKVNEGIDEKSVEFDPRYHISEEWDSNKSGVKYDDLEELEPIKA